MRVLLARGKLQNGLAKTSWIYQLLKAIAGILPEKFMKATVVDALEARVKPKKKALRNRRIDPHLAESLAAARLVKQLHCSFVTTPHFK